MLTETLSVTRLTVVLPILTTLSVGRIRFRLTVERVIDLRPLRTPKATYTLSFRTESISEALETHSACDHLGWGNDIDSLPGQVFGLLSCTSGADAERDAIRTVLGELQQQASEGEFDLATKRVLLALWAGIDASPATP